MKRTNKGAQSSQRRDQPPAEFVEKRPSAEGNRAQTAVTGTQRPAAASIGLNRVREAAKRDKDLRFINLLHHIDIERLNVAYLSLNSKAATGVDGGRINKTRLARIKKGKGYPAYSALQEYIQKYGAKGI